MKHTQGPWIYQNTGPDSHNQGVVYSKETGESIAVAYDRKNLKAIAAVPDLIDALLFVQEAIALWRDGGPHLRHPEHGLLTLEEVKYCVVDDALSKLTD
jgi:hypothetical protein